MKYLEPAASHPQQLEHKEQRRFGYLDTYKYKCFPHIFPVFFLGIHRRHITLLQ